MADNVPNIDFGDLNEEQLRKELINRVELISQLRTHRDYLLDIQSGYQKQEETTK